MKERLLTSWADTFRQEVFGRIPETLFAPLFSDIESRPNAPINVIIGGEILKAGFGWTDEELVDHLGFDLLTRHALGLDEVRAEAPTIRTFYNLRRRVREYAQENGQNLYSEVFAHITDEQISKFAVKTNWQRMDSTQLLSNIALMNRLELVIATLQKGVSGLPKALQQQWGQAQESYLSQPAQTICYRLKAADATPHLQAVGQLLLQVWMQLEAHEADASLIAIVARVIREQYQVEGENVITLRPAAAISGDSLQSPHDPEATYRHKHEQGYKGYVTNLSETCDPTNAVQLITSVQTAPNCVDDGQLLADTLIDLAQRQVVIDQATVDGGYNGPTSEAACRQHCVQLRPTTIRGGQTDWTNLLRLVQSSAYHLFFIP
ncbi:MAG: transposase [Chloroflexi bacterium]|nr:transposase [Chloroflexota bacterium]